MMLRAWCMSVALTCTLWAGCVDDEPAVPQQTPEPEVSEPPGLLYLNFPGGCPNTNAGLTTYNLTQRESESSTTCGPDPLSWPLYPHYPCATFYVHDPDYAVREGDSIHLGIGVAVGPTAGAEVYFTWYDADGPIATTTYDVGPTLASYPLPVETNATVLRNSTHHIFLVVQVLSSPCHGVSVGGQTPSFFEVNPLADASAA